VSPDPNAIGLNSRYAFRAAVSPPWTDAEFLPWMRVYVKKHNIAAIEPGGILELFRPCFEEFRPLLPVASEAQLVYPSLTKFDVFRRLLEGSGDPRVAKNLPETLLLERARKFDMSLLQRLPYPAFLKTDGVYSRNGKTGAVVSVASPGVARECITELWHDYDRITIQGFAPGRGAAAVFIVWSGEVRAEFMNLCLHEVPHQGGYFSLRESWHHDEMLEDARRKLTHLGWQGVAMLEYRFDPSTGKFFFIELNARFWAALHVALYAGADLPRLLMDTFFGHPEPPLRHYRIGVKSRYTFPFELGYLLSVLRDSELPNWRRLLPLIEFLLLSIDPRVRADLYFPGDRWLYGLQLRRTLAAIFGSVFQRLLRQ
jgi:hypothetical protein